MMHVARRIVSAAIPFGAMALAAALAGCPSNPSCGVSPCSDVIGVDARDAIDSARDSNTDAADVDIHAQDIVTLRIDPADTTLMSMDGSRPAQTFHAIGQRRDGTDTAPLMAIWTLPPNAIGAIDATGLFTASGQAGGVLTLHADVAVSGSTVSAMTTVTVRAQRTIIAAGAPADAATHFGSPGITDAARAATLVYPLDGAVMPQNVYPADLQWLHGTAGDIDRIVFHKPSIDITAYVMETASSRRDWLVETAAWRALAQSDPDAAATISIDRWEAASGQVISQSPTHLRFANGSVLGTIYYWDIQAGRAVRIADGTATRENFMPNPPVTPRSGEQCLGCHTVSRDGRFFAGRGNGSTGNGAGMTFDLTVDLSGNPAATLFPITTSSIDWLGSSFSPDSTRLIVDQDGPLRLVDPATGAIVPPASGTLPATGCTMPAWSPDGNTIAYVTNKSGDIAHLVAGDLATLPVTGHDAFGAPTPLHTATSLPGGPTDSYPTWAPDSHWIAFANGDTARSEVGHDSLYLIPAAGGTPTRLDHACGGAAETDNFVPNFSPFNAGGYFWLVFLSKRDYGNALAGTQNTQRQQIWVTAISNHPTSGTDPSEVPYWLPGQDTATRNISAYWAPRACRRDGDGCAVATECCSGLCMDTGTGHTTCTPPPPAMCRMRDQPCGGAGCCAGLVCLGNVCSDPPPG